MATPTKTNLTTRGKDRLIALSCLFSVASQSVVQRFYQLFYHKESEMVCQARERPGPSKRNEESLSSSCTHTQQQLSQHYHSDKDIYDTAATDKEPEYKEDPDTRE